MELWMLLVVFLSNVVQAITGFAGTMLAMPVSIRLIGHAPAAALLNAMGLAASLLIAVPERKRVDWRCFRHILLCMLPGMAVGLVLIRLVDFSILKTFYALFVILMALTRLLSKNQKPLPRAVREGMIPLAGVMHGMFVSGGSLLVLYAAERLPEKSSFRATLSMCWVALNGVLLIAHIVGGNFAGGTALLTLLSLLALVPALLIGNFLHARVSQKLFLRFSYALLVLSGITLLL